MQFAFHADFTEIPADEWNHLASAGISDTPFARHEYLRLWWQTRGGGEWSDGELVLVSASEAGQLVGIAPLFAAHHDGGPALLLVGSIEISDYLDLIVRGPNVQAFLDGLLGELQSKPRFKNMPLDWYNIADTSPTLGALRAWATGHGWDCLEDIFRPTPRIALEGDFEAYLTKLDKKQRHEIRRKMRRAAEGSTPATFELLEGGPIDEVVIDAFLDLMAHDPDKERFLTPQMREHMRSLMHVAAEQGYLSLAFLNVDGRRAAATLNFDYGGRLWGYNSAVNRDFLDLSPGWVLLAHQLKWACEHGRSEFDFMRGNETYKYRFGAVDRYVKRARLVPA